MRIGYFQNKAYSVSGSGPFDVEEIIDDARRAREDGLASYWVGQQFDWDAISLLCVIGREVPDIELGPNVTHMWTSFPVHTAQQAATANLLTGGRFTLGLGVEHKWVMQQMWGLPFDKPVAQFTEYVQVVTELLRKGAVQFEGEYYTVNTFFARFGPQPDIPVILGALGPRMLRLAGTRADGTMTWLTGVNTIRDHIVPAISRAAGEAGRPAPRVVANMPIAVTSDPQGARERITQQMSVYHQMDSYQAMLHKEGVAAAGDIAIVGGRDQVEDQLGALAEAGATDLGAIVFGDRCEREGARDLLRDLAAANGTASQVRRTASTAGSVAAGAGPDQVSKS